MGMRPTKATALLRAVSVLRDLRARTVGPKCVPKTAMVEELALMACAPALPITRAPIVVNWLALTDARATANASTDHACARRTLGRTIALSQRAGPRCVPTKAPA